MENSCQNEHQKLVPVPFNGQSYQKGPGTSAQLVFRSQNKFRKISLLYII